MSVAQEIKSRLDIVDVVSDYVDLRKSGRNYSGFCPFHSNSRTPAFFVSPEKQTWRCFGACAEGGDVFSFVMKKEGIDFKEALKMLAQRAGVELPEYRPKDPNQQEIEDKLGDLLSAAADYYNQLLLYAPEAEFARNYVNSRDLSDDTIAKFKLGYSLNSWDACRTHFQAQGYSQHDLIDAGLLTTNEEKGTAYDRFRNRLMFPINDLNGRVVGFGARTLEKDGIPKYLNSPQTELFDKSRLLYALDFGKISIREARQAVIVEGYMDVIRAHQAGFNNVVAQMGTALTETQLQQLKRYTKRFVIALDADEAGFNATMRSLDVARETLDREFEVQFNARGLVKHEGRLKADIRVAAIPEGKDPDDFIRATPEKWPQLVSDAKPVVEYVITSLAAELDMSDAKAKAVVAQRIIPLIRDIGDGIERNHYWQMLARALQIDERALRRYAQSGKANNARRKRTNTPSAAPKAKPSTTLTQKIVAPLLTKQLEIDYLRESLQQPRLMVEVDKQLSRAQQPLVTRHDFTASEDQALWQHLRRRAHAPADQVVSVEELCDSLDAVLSSYVQSIMATPSSSDAEFVQLSLRQTNSVLAWRLDKIRKELSEVKQLMIEAKRAGDVEASETYAYKCQELSIKMYSINQAKHGLSARQQ